jgi:hypothetical protein
VSGRKGVFRLSAASRAGADKHEWADNQAFFELFEQVVFSGAIRRALI